MVIFLDKYIPRGTSKICSTGKQKYLVWAFVQVEIQLQFIDSMKIACVNTMSETVLTHAPLVKDRNMYMRSFLPRLSTQSRYEIESLPLFN